MELLLIGESQLHHKNRAALEKYNIKRVISEPNVVYIPGHPIDIQQYPTAKCIFGPHFSVFPLEKQMNSIKGCTYIQPSDWVKMLWQSFEICKDVRIETLPWGVDTDRFTEIKCLKQRQKVFIYYKRRDPNELLFLRKFLDDHKVEYRIFDYVERYDENEYLEYLQNSKYGIILDAHESQGFAIEEAMSCNVPLLVWNVSNMKQEYGSNYDPWPATSIPYWDNRCGEVFYKANELEDACNKFIDNLTNYNPRSYVLENLSIEVCGRKFRELVAKI